MNDKKKKKTFRTTITEKAWSIRKKNKQSKNWST